MRIEKYALIISLYKESEGDDRRYRAKADWKRFRFKGYIASHDMRADA